HGVRLQSAFTLDIAGSADGPPRWLRLARDGVQITGYESADGTQWTPVGTVTLDGLPDTVEVGLFVASPGVFTVEREYGSTSTGYDPPLGRATFDNVRLTTSAAADGAAASGGGADGAWRGEDVGPPAE